MARQVLTDIVVLGLLETGVRGNPKVFLHV